MTIKIEEYIGDRATDMAQGDVICKLIEDAFDRGEKVVLDFSGLKTILSTFLNNAVGALYKKHDSAFLNQHLKVIGLDDEDIFILKRVTHRAKEYYADEEAVTKSLDEDLAEG